MRLCEVVMMGMASLVRLGKILKGLKVLVDVGRGRVGLSEAG